MTALDRVPGREPGYALGVAMVVAAGACLSTGGLIVRHVETADGWQILVFRSFAFALTLLGLVVLREGRHTVAAFRRIGRAGLIVALVLGFSFCCYLFALLLTTVANVVFVMAGSPIYTALLAWAVLGERVGRLMATTIAVALAGIVIMVADGLETGQWLGLVVAMGGSLSFAVMVVILRRHREVDMLPATCLGGVVAGLAGLAMAGDLAISVNDMGLAMLMGIVQIGFGFALITYGARSVPAAEVALLSLSETGLAPLWVWWAVGEVPSVETLVGGALVVAAVAVHALLSLRR